VDTTLFCYNWTNTLAW